MGFGGSDDIPEGHGGGVDGGGARGVLHAAGVPRSAALGAAAARFRRASGSFREGGLMLSARDRALAVTGKPEKPRPSGRGGIGRHA
jgi:hypothetical protein